jgi:hypothetical protein
MARTLTDINVDARFDAVSLRATTDDADFTDRPTEVNTTGIVLIQLPQISLLIMLQQVFLVVE